ncbi:MAG: 1-aminocyclopropane-1-carboxylate deaminase/D-cysteine desulfhydrase [Campylobacterales bacterium]|nr:1-aminocyclopropane-1-carboxylate deaminase/D-cysteine desulfhydrase [Campylobacterales bacterium]
MLSLSNTNFINSPVEKIFFENRFFYIKRDDLLHKDFSGNKARKFLYFLVNQFDNIHTVVSYGSNQSNAMYTLSVLAKMKNWKFIYFIDHISSFLSSQPIGNYKHSLDNNMKIFFDKTEYFKLKATNPKGYLFVDEGGAIQEASYGIKTLGAEVEEFARKNKLKNPKIFLPSGTGTTALFLQSCTKIPVFTSPCVGDSNYLKQEFFNLQNNEQLHPTILNPIKKYHFGKLYKNFYDMYKDLLNQTNIEFDLLYDPQGWEVVLSHPHIFDHETIYIHQGGIIGNESMLERYKRKWV